MTILELREKKVLLRGQMNEIIKKGEVEKRKLTDDEHGQVLDFVTKIDEVEKQIAEKEKELRSQPPAPAPAAKRPFSLLRAIRAISENREMDETEIDVINAGREEMRKSAQSCAGQIILPMEYRANIQATVLTQGIENVPEDKLSILEPLRNRLVMIQAGATYMQGLVGDISIPVYSGSNVAWAGEVAAAADGAGAWSEIMLQPKRLTAFINISKQFLIQDSNSAESMLRADLVRAISEKLEMTLLGNAAGSAIQPAGIANLIAPPATAIASWADVVGLEEALELANVYGNYVYVLHPSTKAALRTLSKDSGSGLFVMENDEINGYRTLSSNGVFTDGLILGNWADYVIGQWGGIDLTVDPYTQAGNGMIRLVINSYFDGKPRRTASFKTAKI